MDSRLWQKEGGMKGSEVGRLREHKELLCSVPRFRTGDLFVSQTSPGCNLSLYTAKAEEGQPA